MSRKQKARKPATSQSVPVASTRPGRSAAGLPSWLATAGALLLIVLAGVIGYANTFHVPFVFDDLPSIVDNPLIKDWERFIGGEGYRFNPRRFIAFFTFALNYRFGALDPVGYHAVNLAIHLLSATLVYALGRLLLATPRLHASRLARHAQSFALMAALLFVAHPIQTQAVTYITQRMATLATLFYLLTVVLYGWGRVKLEKAGNRKSEIGNSENDSRFTIHDFRPFLFFAGALASAVLALRCKEIAFTLPLAVLLFEFTCFRGRWGQRLLLVVPVAAVGALGALTLLRTGKPLGDLLSDISQLTRETDLISRHDYLLTQFQVIVTYLRLLLFPVNQNLDYDYPIATSFFTPGVFLSFLLLAGLLGVAGGLFWKTRESGIGNRKSEGEHAQASGPDSRFPIHDFRFSDPGFRLVAFGLAWFFLALAIESSVIPIRDVIFEHRLYLPAAGAALAAAALWAFCLERCPIACRFGAALVVVVLLVATWQRNTVWGDVFSLWLDTAGKSPNKARVVYNLGKCYSLAGQTDLAIAQFKEALRLRGPDPDTLAALAIELKQTGKVDVAEALLKEALQLNPRHAVSQSNYGVLLFERGETAEGLRYLQEAVQGEPNNPLVHFNLGLGYRRLGDLPKAIGEYQQALRLDPGYANAYNNLGTVYYSRAEYLLAEQQFRKALDLQPDNVKFRENLEHARKALRDTSSRRGGE